MKKDVVLYLMIIALMSITLWFVIIYQFTRPTADECGRSSPPACAEMGDCVYDFKDCEYEMLDEGLS